jgi:ribonuclease HI
MHLGNMTVKNFYNAIRTTHGLPNWIGWRVKVWKWKLQLKIILFFWLAAENKILSWDVLQKKGWNGPGFCILCRESEEDINHLFIHCKFIKSVWVICSHFLNSSCSWSDNTINECMDSWLLCKAASKKLPILLSWFTWNERNKALFEGKSPSGWVVVHRTLGALTKFHTVKYSQVLRVSPVIRLIGYSLAFFDGASIAGGSGCGAGGTLKLIEGPIINWLFNCGEGSNTKAELVGAWASLTIARILEIKLVQILGDSKTIIEWLNHKGNLQATNIEGWKSRIRMLVSTFQDINFQHIYREFNVEVDLLSKQALTSTRGRLTYYQWDGERAGPTHHIHFF